MSLVPYSGRGRFTRTIAAVATAAATVTMIGVAPSIAQADAPARVTPTANPNLGKACGLDVVVALDYSYSIFQSKAIPSVEAAAKSIVNSVSDTNTRVGIVKFSSKAGSVLPLTLATTASVGENGQHSTAIAKDFSSGRTNWQDAFDVAETQFSSARAVPKLLVVVTDGAPNSYNSSGPNPIETDEGAPVTVDAAVNVTNRLKASGVHVLAVGTGKAFSTDAGAADRLDALKRISQFTSPQVYPGSALDPSTTDLILQPDITGLAETFRVAATKLCSGGLSITGLRSTPTDPSRYTKPATGSTFTASVSPAGGWVLPVSGSATTRSATTNAGGTSTFQWNPGVSTWTKRVTFSQAPASGYALRNVVCTSAGSTIPVDMISKTLYAVDVRSSASVRCLVRTRWTGPIVSTVALSATPRIVRLGGTTKLVVKVTNYKGPLAGRVTLQSRASSSAPWRTVTSLRLDKFGVAKSTRTLTASRTYRAVYARTATQMIGVSAPLSITVAPIVTMVASKTTVNLGGNLVLTGQIQPTRARTALLRLQVKSGASWVAVKVIPVAASGKFTVTIRPTSKGSVVYRAVLAAGTIFASATSNQVAVRVA